MIDPKVVEYQFPDKKKGPGHFITARKFTCLLVSASAGHFMMGEVKWNFSKPSGADDALRKFSHGSVWEIKEPNIDTGAQPRYNSCPIKTVLLLDPPTKVKMMTFVQEVEKHPARHILVKESVERVCEMVRRGAGNGSGGGSVSRTLVNMCGKVISKSNPRATVSKGKTRHVMTVELAGSDTKGVEFAVWDDAVGNFQGVSINDGVTLVGVTASVEEGQVKFAMWDNARVLKGGEVADEFTRMEAKEQMTYLTPTFTPSGPNVTKESECFPVVAGALSATQHAVTLTQQICIQVNRGSLELPLSRELLITQKGDRLYATGCQLRDWSGGVSVDATQDLILHVTGKTSMEELLTCLDEGKLSQVTGRFNVRGIIRSDGERTKIIMCLAQASTFESDPPSELALHQMLGLGAITGNMVLPAPADMVGDDPALGMVVKIGENMTSVHRLLMLVQGTETSKLEKLDEQDTVYRVSSLNVKCMVSKKEDNKGKDFHLDLHGYCPFDNMLEHNLGKDTALVCVSAWDVNEGGRPIATVEYMTKVNTDVDKVIRHLLAEWNAASMSHATEQGQLIINPGTNEYWSRPAKRLKRMSSEATPEAESAAVAAGAAAAAAVAAIAAGAAVPEDAAA